MEKHKITPTFYLALLEFLMNAKQQIVTIGAEFGLTSIQAITLLLVDKELPRPMKNFCALYHCDASNITGIVDGLEQKGLVSRQNDPHDRRIKVICLEPTGQVLQQTMIERLNDETGFLFQVLDTTERQQFMSIVEKIAAASKSTS